MIIPEIYRSKVNSRSMSRYYIGLIVRFLLNIKYAVFRWMARHNGATIGENTLITWKLARRANKNLIIGEDCSIETANLDLRFGGGKNYNSRSCNYQQGNTNYSCFPPYR